MTDHTAIVARLRTVELDDHERGCQMRYCACTCGFDDAAILAAKEAADAIESLQAELVKTREQAEKMAEALEAVFDRLDHGLNGPGHGHLIAGVWDNDNAPGVAGTECSWCATWNEARQALAEWKAT